VRVRRSNFRRANHKIFFRPSKIFNFDQKIEKTLGIIREYVKSQVRPGKVREKKS
jgi:hypothetical protein